MPITHHNSWRPLYWGYHWKIGLKNNENYPQQGLWIAGHRLAIYILKAIFQCFLHWKLNSIHLQYWDGRRSPNSENFIVIWDDLKWTDPQNEYCANRKTGVLLVVSLWNSLHLNRIGSWMLNGSLSPMLPKTEDLQYGCQRMSHVIWKFSNPASCMMPVLLRLTRTANGCSEGVLEWQQSV